MKSFVSIIWRSVFLVSMLGGVFTVHAGGCTGIASLPTTISTPGIYCLSNDLVFSGFGAAITVQADDVTLDFKGHEIRGTFIQNMVGVAAGAVSSVVVRNGKITNASTAVGVGRNGLVENMIINDVRTGIGVGGEYSVVRNNIITDVVPKFEVGSAGILVSNGCGVVLENNTVKNFRQFQGSLSPSTYGNGIRIIGGCSVLIKNNFIYGTAVSGAGETAGIDDTNSGSLIIGNVFGGFVTKNLKCVSTTRYKDNISNSIYGLGLYNCSPSGDLGGNL